MRDMKEREAAQPLSLSVTAAQRVKGLLFAEPSEGVMLLAPCNDVHTVGMGHPIDVAFVGRDGCVLEARRNVGSMRRLRNRRAVAVVERFSSDAATWFEVGEQLGILGMEGTEL